jgi:hypothetical protein
LLSDCAAHSSGLWQPGVVLPHLGLLALELYQRVRQAMHAASDMAHAGVNGSNRILSHGAPPPRMMPNGCLRSPVFVLIRS